MQLATVSTRGAEALLETAVDPIPAFWLELSATPPPGADAVSWAVADVARNEPDQIAALTATPPLSSAGYGNSPHNYARPLGVDIWAINTSGAVIADPSHPAYSRLAQLAGEYGLRTGAAWGDAGHVEVPDWMQRVRDDRPPVVARAGLSPMVLVLGVGAFLWMRARG